MREIRFRGIAESTHKMVYGNILSFDEEIHQVFLSHIKCGYRDTLWKEIVNGTLQQFTGQRDKKGREIYEGDLFDLGDFKAYVVFETETTSFCLRKHGVKDPHWRLPLETSFCINYEVIGYDYLGKTVLYNI